MEIFPSFTPTFTNLFLVDIALRLHKRGMSEKPYCNISELQLLFNQRLFSGKAGQGEQKIHYVKFDETNAVKKIYLKPTLGAVGLISEMRAILINGKNFLVQVDFSKKNSVNQILKCMTKNLNEETNEWDPLGVDKNGVDLLPDRQRFRIVTENEEDIASVHSVVGNFS